MGKERKEGGLKTNSKNVNSLFGGLKDRVSFLHIFTA
jgi:hypothetical protein